MSGARVVRHGTNSAYANGCRCQDCRLAHRAASRSYRDRRVTRLAADPRLAPHGVVATYNNWGCRCDPCTEANSQACKDYKRTRRSAGAR